MGLTEAPRGAVGIAGARDHVGAERPRRVKFVLVLRTFLDITFNFILRRGIKSLSRKLLVGP